MTAMATEHKPQGRRSEESHNRSSKISNNQVVLTIGDVVRCLTRTWEKDTGVAWRFEPRARLLLLVSDASPILNLRLI